MQSYTTSPIAQFYLFHRLGHHQHKFSKLTNLGQLIINIEFLMEQTISLVLLCLLVQARSELQDPHILEPSMFT